MIVTKVSEIIFFSRKNIPWKSVAEYLKRYQGTSYTVEEYDDRIIFNMTSVDEYTSSTYTRRLKGTLAKAKANIVQILPELIRTATNRRWIENNDEKHKNNASKGWYRYDTYFELPIQAEDDENIHWNRYRETMIVRVNDRGLFFYDIINIKKEVSNPR
ncbi:MAG: hypothetical protein J6N76_08320 [Lachnospiraceae bacterium]|nr:hypothetical protein [Lachnospiraceae bacterium]